MPLCTIDLASLSFARMIWYLFVMLQIVLLAPIIFFWVVGRVRKKNEIIDCFSATAALFYMRCFHPSDVQDIDDADPARDQRGLKAFESYYERQFGWQRTVLPTVLLAALSGGLLYMAARAAMDWNQQQKLEG